MTRPDTDDFHTLFLNDAPLLDVRAPVEFAKGALPGAVNLPLMDDDQRHRVGICYMQQGQAAALALGHRLVSGQVRQARIDAWLDFARAHPEGWLYCFRGGLRSQIVQQWLREAGVAYPRLRGGYKAGRGFLIDAIEGAVAECGLLVLGGMTGTGKTDVLRRLASGVDLEAHARHRGSSFGRRLAAQPCQVDFENALALDVLRKRAEGRSRFVVEDEGQAIGSCSLPFALHRRMQQQPMVWLEDGLPSRVTRILQDYVIDLCAEFVDAHGPQEGFALFAQRLRGSLDRIRKRLGGVRHQRLCAQLQAALQAQERSGDVEPHRAWIEALLTDYYDPMYAYQRELKRSRIVFSGRAEDVLAYLLHAGDAARQGRPDGTLAWRM